MEFGKEVPKEAATGFVRGDPCKDFAAFALDKRRELLGATNLLTV